MIEIVFISSSRTKFSHIKFGLEGTKYSIVPQKNYGIGYKEPRIYDREELLKISYVDARRRFEKSVTRAENKFFILEDTSVRIEALSKDEREVPGLDIKYWMQENTFDTVDTLLLESNNRKCVVRSDILLHLPKKLQDKYKKEYIVFTGRQEGFICKKEKTFNTNSLYPWLDNKTFNKWFVPQGYEVEDTVISQLDIIDACKYDFRLQAIKKLIYFLDNEDLDNYKKSNKPPYIPSLFESSTFILLGSTCAGKSTLAEYMADTYGYYHIEASDFMYLEYHKRHGVNPSVAIGDFAQDVLKRNPIIVAKQVTEFCDKLSTIPIVISGFRTIQEVEYFEKHHKKNIQTLYIDTEQKIRYERCKNRNRKDVALTFENFQKKDMQQYAMGIDVLEQSIEDKIQNNDNFEKYYNAFEVSFNSLIKSYSLNPTKDIENMRLEDLILIVLNDKVGNFYTTTEIAKLINEKYPLLKPKSKNNVSRYFNQAFHPYYDIHTENGTNKYTINTTGMSQARYLLS